MTTQESYIPTNAENNSINHINERKFIISMENTLV